MGTSAQDRIGRRLAAILAADVAGYSRLTGLDEEGTLKRLRKLRRELINPAVDRTFDGLGKLLVLCVNRANLSLERMMSCHSDLSCSSS